MLKTITKFIVLAVIVALVGWDIYVALANAPEATISAIIQNAAFHSPIVPFAAGILCGHWFWPVRLS